MSIRLNLGCGTDIRKDYTNIDVRKSHPSVVEADVRALPYEPNSVDEVFAQDVYEHVSFRESKDMLKHWVSIIKPGGVLYIHTSCFISISEFMAKSDTVEKMERTIAIIFGGQDYPENFHTTAGHPVLFKKYLRDAGVEGEIVIKTGIGNGCGMSVRAIK